MSEQFDVAIVGYGPTGLVLASALGRNGHRVVVVERWPDLYGLPRLSHIDDEVARIIQATADVEEALKDSQPYSAYRFLNAAGETLTVLGGEGGLGPAGFAPDISIYQPDIDAAIDRRVQTFPSIERLLGFEAVSLTQDDDGVTLTVRPVGEQAAVRDREIRARYLVGADGARSFVRQTLGIERSDLGFNERWINIDVERLRELPERFSETVQICDPARGHMHLPIGTKRVRFELALLPDERAEDFLTPEFAWRWLREEHGLGPDDVAIIRHIVYTFEARAADRWQVGRVLLAGDACHTMPPYLGQGACSGMRDAFTLAWRLDLILRGIARPDLLADYERERRPHVEVITRMAIGLGKIANERDPERASLRDEALRSHPPSKPALPTITAGTLAPGDQPLAGTLMPQGIVERHGRRGRFDDVVGRGFVLVSQHRPRKQFAGDLADRFERAGGILVALDEMDDVDGTYTSYLRANNVVAVLSRPDFIVFGATASSDAIQDLVEQLLEAVGETSSPTRPVLQGA